MPVITLEAGNLSIEQKKELISRFTDTAVEVTKIPKQYFIVLIKELPLENMGFAGITVDTIKKQENI